jgi:ribosomal protein L16/L10AE
MPMGTGKWDVDIYTAPVRKGRVLFELTGLSLRQKLVKTLIKASKKLSVKARVVAKWEIR